MQNQTETAPAPETYFHLGFPKVASTFFQQEVFPKLAGVQYYPKRKFKLYKQLSPAEMEGKYLFSTEKDNGLEEAVEDIVEHFPEARFILFFRRPDKWLLSRYKYHIRKHGRLRYREFFDIHSDTGMWNIFDLRYRERIERVTALSNHPPLVLTFEEFQQQPEQFLGKLLTYIGTEFSSPVNLQKRFKPAFQPRQLTLLRQFNRGYPFIDRRHAPKPLKKIYEKYREFLLHTLAFLFRAAPKKVLEKKPLLTPAEWDALEQTRQAFTEDWTYCRHHYENNFAQPREQVAVALG